MAGSVYELLASLSRCAITASTMRDTVDRVCDAALRAVLPAIAAGVTMTLDADTDTYAATTQEAAAADHVQYGSGEGPCVDAFRDGIVVEVRSTHASSRYRPFCDAAAAGGYGSVLAVPLRAGGTPTGVLGLFAPAEAAFGPADVQLATIFADHAAHVLANARAYWDARTLGDHLAQALESRAEIEQAKGIIMATTRCSAEMAFERLKEQSQHENRKLREVARELVQRYDA